MHGVLASEAAAIANVAALAHSVQKSREQLRRMLKIRVDDSEESGV